MPTYTQGLNKKGGEYQLKLEVTQKSQSVANNTSSVYGRAYLYKNSSSAQTGNWNNNNSSWNMNIGGNKKSGSVKYDFRNRANYGSQDLGSGTWTIGHNSDGTKSISVSASFSDNGGAIGSGSISKSMTLTTIPRKSKVTGYVLNSRTLDSLNIGWSADKAISQTSWRVNGGSWNTVNASGTSGSFTVGGLSPGGSYSVDFQVKNRDSGLWSDNMNLGASTYAKATATVGNWNISDNVTATISREHSSIQASVYLQMWADSQQWVTVDTLHNVTGNATFTMNDSKRAIILQNRRYSKTFSYQVQVASKWGSGGSNQGSTYSNQATGTINTVGNPTIGTLSYYDETASMVAITGDKTQLIQNQSSLVLSISSFKSNGYAYLTRALMTVGGNTSQLNLSGSSEGTRTVRLGKINSDSNATVSVTVYDSRGQTSSESITVKMIPYAPPAVINLKPAREHGYEEPSYLRATPRISHINRKNTGKFRYRIKQTTTSTWGAWQEVPISSPSVSGNYFNYSVNRYMADYPNDREYNIETQVSDRIYGWTGTTSAILRRGIPLLKFEETKLTAGVTFNAAKGIHIPDTRNDNNPPSWYYTNYPYSHTIEFKLRDKIGVPGSGLYVSLHSITRWGDKSGGNVTQTAYSDSDIYYRTGTDSSWGGWTRQLTSSGGVVDGRLTLQDGIESSKSFGSLWIDGKNRKGMIDYNITPGSSYHNILRAKADSGYWSMGTINNRFGLQWYKSSTTDNVTDGHVYVDSTNNQLVTSFNLYLPGGQVRDHVIETGSNSRGSWRKWSSGEMEMWGSGTYTGSESDSRSKITLPTSCVFDIGRDSIIVQDRNYSPNTPTYTVFEPTNSYFMVIGKFLTTQGWVGNKNIYWSVRTRWK